MNGIHLIHPRRNSKRAGNTHSINPQIKSLIHIKEDSNRFNNSRINDFDKEWKKEINDDEIKVCL